MTDYYRKKDLKRFSEVSEGAPDLFSKFQAWYGEATSKSGALSVREKALIGLAVSHAIQCPYCIESFTQKCLESGADLDQMTEAVHVAAAMKAGACLIHGVQMKDKHDSLSI
jgi:alkylhydroperoxidase/carboxymuconolactone decarboxylase family protein